MIVPRVGGFDGSGADVNVVVAVAAGAAGDFEPRGADAQPDDVRSHKAIPNGMPAILGIWRGRVDVAGVTRRT